MEIVIVGGVAGGMSAATRLRRLDEDAHIVVLERSGYVSFANCGLPYYLGAVIDSRADLLLQTPQSLAARFRLDVRVNHNVTAIDRTAKRVQVTDLASGTQYDIAYDALILSPGAQPVVPPIAGIERALTIRDVEDTDAIMERLADAQSAVIVGGGFIGVEMAENLHRRGLQVALVEATQQVMAPLDPEMAQIVHERLRQQVDLHLGAALTQVDAQSVTLSTGARLEADLVIAAIGVKPDATLAVRAGLQVSEHGAIVVDQNFRTSDPSIYAVGDAVLKRDALTGHGVLVPLANTANRQGRVVADVIAGAGGTDRKVLGTAIVGVFGLQVGATGWNEKRLRAAGRAYLAIHTHPADHATYYPGASSLSLKLLADPVTGEILGAQGVGAAGVDKRIDVIATAMAGGLTAPQLADLELAYAPQFGSAKDPINMLGYIADNHLSGLSASVQWHELDAALAGGATLIDVRTAAEHAAGSIAGAVNIPLDELRERCGEINGTDLIVHCAVGLRGHTAARILAQHNFTVRNLDGGYRTWRAGTAAAAPA